MKSTLPPVVLFSQSDVNDLPNGYLVRLLESIAAQNWKGPLELYLIMNRSRGAEVAALQKTYKFLHVTYIPGRLSLSANRNTLLREHLASVQDNALVAFPDDDAYYPADFLAKVVKTMATEKLACLTTSTNDPADTHNDRFPRNGGPLDIPTALYAVNSNTVFLTGKTAKQVGLFAEDFGLGTGAIGGEDNEYILRFLQTGGKAAYHPELIIGHPVKEGIKDKYYPAGILLYARHYRQLHGHMQPFFFPKRFLRGLQYVATGKMPFKSFRYTWTRAIKELLTHGK